MSHQPLWLRDLVAYSIQAAALVGVGTIMVNLLRLRMPRVRLAYWQALLTVCVFLPLLQPWRPEILETPSFAMSDINLAATEAPSTPVGPSLAEIALWLICAGVAVRLAWMALGFGRLWLYRRHAERINQTPEALREAQRLVPASSSFFISRQIPTPATFGFFHPGILFPARFLEMEPAVQKAIALHELLHVERRDWLWNIFEEIVLTLLWFHLPLWWVVRSARLSREQVVDAEAIRRSKARRPYLKALLEMAGQKRLAESLPAPLFLRESQLAERVALMMKEVHMSRTRLMVSILTSAVTLLIAGSTLVWAFPLKTAAQQTEAPAASSEPAEDGAGTYQFHGKDYKFLGKVYKVGGEVSAPVPIYKPEPPYTPEARKAHLSGPVVLWAVINTKGDVVEVREQSKPLGQGLDESALNKVRTWKFKPGMREGVPVPVKVMVEVYFRYYDDKKSDPASRKPRATSDPPAQESPNASTKKEPDQGAYVNQADIQRQVDQAMKQLRMAEVHTPKIDEAKINQQIEQAMKQAQMAQDAVPNIDQKKLQEQIEQGMKQFEKMNTPEMRQQMQEQMKALEKTNTPEMRRQMKEAMKRLQAFNTPEVRKHMQEQMEQLKKLNTSEMRRQMQEQMEQLKKMSTPEMRQQFKQAMEQAKIAQETASKMNQDEVQRELKQAKEEVEQARKEAQAAREEARKARQDAMKARREAEEQRKAGKPAPSATPKPAPVPPREITPPPPPPPPQALPKTPDSAAIVGGVRGGVVGGVPGGVVEGVPGGKVKGIRGGQVIGVPGGITGGVITAPHPPVPPSASPKEAVVPPAPASPTPPPPQN